MDAAVGRIVESYEGKQRTESAPATMIPFNPEQVSTQTNEVVADNPTQYIVLVWDIAEELLPPALATAVLSEAALSLIWDDPDEDEAWKDL